jgi:Fe-S-cluster containining protein
VRVAEAEIVRLSAYLGVCEHDFIQQYARLRDDRLGLALMDKPDGGCIFLDGHECLVQPVKPQQCRDFPHLWRHPDFERNCHAIAREVSDDDYCQRVAQATGRRPEEIEAMKKGNAI